MPALEERRNGARVTRDGRRPGAAAARLVAVLVALLGLTLAAGWLLTRAEEGDAFEQRDATLVQWFADNRTAVLDDLSGPAAELGNTWVVVGVAVGGGGGAGLGGPPGWPALGPAGAPLGRAGRIPGGTRRPRPAP